nr:PREDICTED: adhesion G protein-coupled receptor E2-like [Latimeria chalumnae]|eukprot:XP_014348146.1 PREDICTED: adhesion G protein-coupled receptor E2-like [Latimeria chalumnae]
MNEDHLLEEEGDIDECKTLGKCPGNSVCYNTHGSYYCNCKPGYRQNRGEYNFTDPTVACNDINDCLEPGSPVCGPNATCRNTFGSFRCTCKSGFRSKTGKEPFHGMNESTCEDINECEEDSTLCNPSGTCINLNGRYMCKCNLGYARNSADLKKKCIGTAQKVYRYVKKCMVTA